MAATEISRSRSFIPRHVLVFLILLGLLHGCGASQTGGDDPGPSPISGDNPPTGDDPPIGETPPSDTDPADPGTEPPPAVVYPSKIDLAMTVKETAGVGAFGFPVTAVVPLPYGKYQSVEAFRVTDNAGTAVPAQFEVLNRHWAKDGSIRHLLVHFQPTVESFTGAGTGTAAYRFRDDGPNAPPANPVTVVSDADKVTVRNGVVSIQVNRNPFGISTPGGSLDAIFTDEAGNIQRSFSRADINLTIEETGPMRAVVRAEAPAIFNGAGDHMHGWAMRLYVYAGKPFVKVDFQLQNSAKNVKYSAPLYFRGFHLELATSVASVAGEVRAEESPADPMAAPLGALDAGGVQTVIRNFRQMWPNGIFSDGAGRVRIDLWPEWGRQIYNDAPSSEDLYWLDDMQHTVKEFFIHYGTTTSAQLENLARTVQFHPVVALPVKWYADTRVTLDLGGIVPADQKMATGDLRLPDYAHYGMDQYANKPMSEKMGWTNFGIDLDRKYATNQTGGWPYSASRFFLTENPSEYFYAEDLAMGDLNIRPQWITGYTYRDDFDRLLLTENPYPGGGEPESSGPSWRAFEGHGVDNIAIPYKAGTGRLARPRDDEHGWFYHIEEAYLITGNPWIRDWYEFVGEFRKTRLNQQDPWPDMTARAIGHSLGHALQAYRVTGDGEILDLFRSYILTNVKPLFDPVSGGRMYENIDSTSPTYGEAMFQLGYLARAIIDYLSEVPAEDPELVGLVEGMVRWNMSHSSFGYYLPADAYNPCSDGSSTTFTDIQAWYVLRHDDQDARAHLLDFIDGGIAKGACVPNPDGTTYNNNGSAPYTQAAYPWAGAPADWQGDFNGRLVDYLMSLNADR